MSLPDFGSNSLMECTLASLGYGGWVIQADSRFGEMPVSGQHAGRRSPQLLTPLSEIMANQSTPLVSGNMFTSNDIYPSPNLSPHGSPTPLFTSSPSKPNSNHSRYKTEICRSFKESGHCKYGEKCQFAHGAEELRTNNRHPKYKTERCRTFHSNGYCPYGPRCHFIHGEDDEKLSEIRSNRGSRHPSGQSITQYPSSPPTPKPNMVSESASGLTFSDHLLSSLRNQIPFQPKSNNAIYDESSNDSFLSFIDIDQPNESAPRQLASPLIQSMAIPVPSRNQSSLPTMPVSPVSMATGSHSGHHNNLALRSNQLNQSFRYIHDDSSMHMPNMQVPDTLAHHRLRQTNFRRLQ